MVDISDTHGIDYNTGFLVPQYWHTIFSFVFLVVSEIYIMQIITAEEFVHSSPGVFLIVLWEPPAGVTLWKWLHDGYVNNIGQTFEMSDEIYTMGEWTE